MAKKDNKSWQILEFLDEIPEDTAMQAVRASGKNIKYIKNPSKAVIDAAIKHTPTSIMFVDNPTIEQIVASCKRAPRLFTKYADILDDESIIEIAATCNNTWIMVGSAAFNRVAPQKAKVIAQVRHESIGKSDLLKRYLTNPTEEIALKLVRKHPSTILIIDNPTDEMFVIAMTKNPKLVTHMNNPPDVAIETACINSTNLVNKYAARLNTEMLNKIIHKIIVRKSIHCANKVRSNSIIMNKITDDVKAMLKSFVDIYDACTSDLEDMDDHEIMNLILMDAQKIKPTDLEYLNDDQLNMLLIQRTDLGVHIPDVEKRFPWFIEYAPHYVASVTNDLETLVQCALFHHGQQIVKMVSAYSHSKEMARRLVEDAIWKYASNDDKLDLGKARDILKQSKNEYDMVILYDMMKRVAQKGKKAYKSIGPYRNLVKKLGEIFVTEMRPHQK